MRSFASLLRKSSERTIDAKRKNELVLEDGVPEALDEGFERLVAHRTEKLFSVERLRETLIRNDQLASVSNAGNNTPQEE